jgi:hypothetical protein
MGAKLPITRTYYSLKNICLLVIALPVCALNALIATMTGGFPGPLKLSFHNGVSVLFLLSSELSFPAFLLLFRWSGIGCRTLWVLTICGIVFGLLAGVFSSVLVNILILTAISIVATFVNDDSMRAR